MFFGILLGEFLKMGLGGPWETSYFTGLSRATCEVAPAALVSLAFDEVLTPPFAIRVPSFCGFLARTDPFLKNSLPLIRKKKKDRTNCKMSQPKSHLESEG